MSDAHDYSAVTLRHLGPYRTFEILGFLWLAQYRTPTSSTPRISYGRSSLARLAHNPVSPRGRLVQASNIVWPDPGVSGGEHWLADRVLRRRRGAAGGRSPVLADQLPHRSRLVLGVLPG